MAARTQSLTLNQIQRWLTVRQAARVIGCSLETVRTLTLSKELRVVETALGRLYDPDDVNRVAKERARK